MNSKSLLFIFALLALFTLASTNVIEKRDLEDDELLSDALSLMQKLLKSKENKEKQRIAESLDVEDVGIEEVDVPEVNNSDEKYIVDANNEDVDYDLVEGLGPDFDEVEVVTVTVEVDENGDPIYDIDLDENVRAMQGIDLDDDVEIEYVNEDDVVEGEEDVEGEDEQINEDDEVAAGVIGDELPEFNVDNDGLNVVAAEFDGEEQGAVVDYVVDENNLEVEDEDVTYYYTVDEGEYNEEEDAIDGVIVDVDTVDNQKSGNKAGVVGASIAIVGAFGVAAGFGYKYSKRSKRILLPFHEELENGEMIDKNNAEQHIIPVWAATCKKEENEEDKEDEEKLFEVVYNYEPELPDELKLTVGDKIKIKEIYEDGWAYGYNKTTQLFGTFPSTSLGENFNPESVPQYKPEEVAVEVNDNMVEELKKKIVESN